MFVCLLVCDLIIILFTFINYKLKMKHNFMMAVLVMMTAKVVNIDNFVKADSGELFLGNEDVDQSTQ